MKIKRPSGGTNYTMKTKKPKAGGKMPNGAKKKAAPKKAAAKKKSSTMKSGASALKTASAKKTAASKKAAKGTLAFKSASSNIKSTRPTAVDKSKVKSAGRKFSASKKK